MKSKLYPFFVGLVFVLLSYGTYLGLVKAPTEATMGDAQRIFYYHVPAAICTYTLFFLNFVASIVYLWKRSELADAWAVTFAEVGLVFATVVMLTGPIWAHYAWGSWWAWDMRLTTFLVLWLLYFSYLALRRSSEAGSSSVLAASLAIFAFLDVPFNYVANRLFTTIHPPPVTLTEPDMKIALMANMIAFMAFAALVVWFRYELEMATQRIARLHIRKATGSTMMACALPALFFFFQTSDQVISDELRAAHAKSHMMGAYIVAWTVYIGYLLMLSRRVVALKREEADLNS